MTQKDNPDGSITTVIEFKPLKGITCPACGGCGRFGYSSLSIGPNRIESTLPPPCHICKGKGRVYATYTPVED